MTTRKKITADAVDAACEATWKSMHRGQWPDACPDPQRWRAEEREALMPALAVLEEEGVLTWPAK